MDLVEQRMTLFRHYREVFGDLVSDGVYRMNEIIMLVNGMKGKVIWKYRSHGDDVMYVLEDDLCFVIGITAEGIAGRA
ncbi:hypothetical protein [Ktedonospora formicarum]|uniref:Uncharacterized protein n=1 Tax=Ktedonospora formicarum TaxID=2778364 RepID=A0A8J3MXS0_9CHLR|nr:hypothetical protein [Ktedonospora formicarum]GHO48890.1 hypothetical protein KSX_70530 [Ktedonospora formicarum]